MGYVICHTFINPEPDSFKSLKDLPLPSSSSWNVLILKRFNIKKSALSSIDVESTARIETADALDYAFEATLSEDNRPIALPNKSEFTPHLLKRIQSYKH